MHVYALSVGGGAETKVWNKTRIGSLACHGYKEGSRARPDLHTAGSCARPTARQLRPIELNGKATFRAINISIINFRVAVTVCAIAN